MIYVGIFDTTGIDPTDTCVTSKIPEELKGRVEKTRNEKEKTLRAGAYILLSEFYKHIFCEKIPPIIFTGDGKPIFNISEYENKSSQINKNFSISHEGSVSAVAFSDGNAPIGIDIQSVPRTRSRIRQISERFFGPIKNLDSASREEKVQNVLQSEDVIFVYYIYKKGNLFEVPYNVFSNTAPAVSLEESDFLEKWTVLESVLKMSGGGFADISSADKLITLSKIKTVSFTRNKKLYALSIAVGIIEK